MAVARFLVAVLICLWVKLTLGAPQPSPAPRVCETIRVPLCSDLGYNQTGMPNLVGNEIQTEAEYYLTTFTPLIQYGCSAQLKLFLCSVYLPMCTEKVSTPIGPCRGLCELVRSRCFPVLQGFGFVWPEALNCSRFPEQNNQEHMCMEGPRDANGTAGIGDVLFHESKVLVPRRPLVPLGPDECPPQHKRDPIVDVCVPECDIDVLFDGAEKRFAEVWVTVWSLTAFTGSLAAALTLSIGGGRLRARPLVSLALCYCALSAGWTLRILLGRSPGTCYRAGVGVGPGGGAGEIVRMDGFSDGRCATVALVLYYFGMASTVWWVCMCGWWVARAGLSWPPERLRNLGTFLHVMAWGLPAAQTAVAIARRDVDIDELTGTCSIGNRNTTTLLALVLIPQAIYLSLGVLLLLLGSVYLLRRPRHHMIVSSGGGGNSGAALPRKHSDILGALSTLYILPVACVLASVWYEYNNYNLWLITTDKPAVWAYLLRHLMSLFVGVSTTFWIWSSKTISAWRNLLRRLGPSPTKPLHHQVVKTGTTIPNVVVRYQPAAATNGSLGGGVCSGGGGGGGGSGLLLRESALGGSMMSQSSRQSGRSHRKVHGHHQRGVGGHGQHHLLQQQQHRPASEGLLLEGGSTLVVLGRK